MSSLSPSQSLVVRPILTGVLNGIAMMSLTPVQSVSISMLGGMKVSTPIFYGVVGASSNLIAGAFSQNLLPKLTDNPMILNNTMITDPVFSGLANVGMSYLLNEKTLSDNDMGFMKVFGVGAASEIAGNYGAQYLSGFNY